MVFFVILQCKKDCTGDMYKTSDPSFFTGQLWQIKINKKADIFHCQVKSDGGNIFKLILKSKTLESTHYYCLAYKQYGFRTGILVQ